MRDDLIIFGAVFAAVAAVATFALASDDVTRGQEKLVKRGIERGAALRKAQTSKARLRRFAVGIPAILAVLLNLLAYFVPPLHGA